MPSEAAAPIPVGLPVGPWPGLDRAWSRTLTAPDAHGDPRTWHLLDSGSPTPGGQPADGVVLCVHGNPTWSYLWRRVLGQAPPGWRVLAVDQLDMGFSERTGRRHTYAERVRELGHLTDALGLREPGSVVLLAHDWGGPVGLGWAVQHRELLAGMVLTNTAVHHPADSMVPTAIRVARSAPLRDLVCHRTAGFVRATTATSRPALPAAVRAAFAAPYTTAERRRGVEQFVADIPLEPGHPSQSALARVADGLGSLAEVPTLMVWGTSDPVFTPRYLTDLLGRLPHADVQRYPGASHLVLEDRPQAVDLLWRWIERLDDAAPPTTDTPTGAAGTDPLTVAVSDPEATAVVELRHDGDRITTGGLAARVASVARTLHARGVRPGTRVAVLVPPGIDLTTLVYAVWQLGAVVVLADAGLGLRRLGAALRAADPQLVLAARSGTVLARASRVPGARVSCTPDDLVALVAEGTSLPEPPRQAACAQAEAAVLFTSGATGPPKGVVYTRDRLAAQLELLRQTFGFDPDERFVAAFAPFALYGPALGLPSVVPDMDVTKPHTLTATALAEAVQAIDATMVFAAPAALRSVVATAADLTDEHRAALATPRLLLSAGAPVPKALLHELAAVLPAAEMQTPYGMTEALPVATIDPRTVQERPGGAGVCVGQPVPGVQVRIAPLDDAGVAAQRLGDDPFVLGELVVRGAHVKARYDRDWAAEQISAQPPGWHRTGDVGELDEDGRLWVHGRLVHVVTTPAGPVAPYAGEQRIAALAEVHEVAIVGVGPVGTQQLVAVVVPPGRLPRFAGSLAGTALAAAVREAAGHPVAAVLVRDWLPVDVRHASKVDRTALADWADAVLHGGSSLLGRRGRLPRRGAPRAAPFTRSR